MKPRSIYLEYLPPERLGSVCLVMNQQSVETGNFLGLVGLTARPYVEKKVCSLGL